MAHIVTDDRKDTVIINKHDKDVEDDRPLKDDGMSAFAVLLAVAAVIVILYLLRFVRL